MRSEPLSLEGYLRDLEREAQRLPWDEREELMQGMRARVAELQGRGLDSSVMSGELERLGRPQQVIDDYLAVVGEPVRPRYRTVLVIIALACVWLSLVSGVFMDPTLLLFDPLPAVLAALAGVVNSVTPLAVLVLSIVGRMWRRWLDGVVTLLLLVITPSASVFLLLSTGTLVDSPFGSAHLTRWIFRGLFVLSLALVVSGTLHWTRRLVLQSRGGRLDARGRGVILAVAGASFVVLAGMAAVTALIRFGPALPFLQPAAGGTFDVRLVNDTGHTVSVTYCPRQDCHGERAIPLAPGSHYDLTAESGTLPDSVVVQAASQPAACALLMDMSPPAVRGFPGPVTTRVKLSRWARPAYCGNDIASLDHPAQSG